MPRPWKSAKSADFHRRLGKSRQKAAGLSHIFHRPYRDLSLSEKPGRQHGEKQRKGTTKNELAHPGSNPVIGIATKQGQCRRRNQDAIEDYSEPRAEVQVLCVRKHRL